MSEKKALREDNFTVQDITNYLYEKKFSKEDCEIVAYII